MRAPSVSKAAPTRKPYDPIYSQIARYTQHLNQITGTRQIELAKSTGISQGRLSDLLRCNKRFSVREVLLVANAYGLTPAEFIAEAQRQAATTP